MPNALETLAREVIEAYSAAGKTIALAESCTGGMVAAALTAIPGSSIAFERGWVTYSNASKCEELAVPSGLIATHGAVSREVAEAMAIGARAKAHCDCAVSITGIAGPGGGSVEKPVGLVWFGVSSAASTNSHTRTFKGDRGEIRAAATDYALQLALSALKVNNV